MKKIIVITAALLSFSTLLTAQEAPRKNKSEIASKKKEAKTPEQVAQKNADGLKAEVASLSDAQKAKVYDLSLAKTKKINEIKEKYKGQENNKDEAKKELDEARKEYKQGVQSILTKEQLEELKSKRKQERTEHKKKANAAGVSEETLIKVEE